MELCNVWPFVIDSCHLAKCFEVHPCWSKYGTLILFNGWVFDSALCFLNGQLYKLPTCSCASSPTPSSPFSAVSRGTCKHDLITSCFKSFGGSLLLAEGNLISWAWCTVLGGSHWLPSLSPTFSSCILGTSRGDHLLCLFYVGWPLPLFAGTASLPGVSFLIHSAKHMPSHLSLLICHLLLFNPWDLDIKESFHPYVDLIKVKWLDKQVLLGFVSLAIIICEYLWT